MDLVILVQDFLFLAGQHQTGQAREKNSNAIHSLNPESSCRVGSVFLGQACVQHSKHSLPMNSKSSSNVGTVTIRRSHDTNMPSLR